MAADRSRRRIVKGDAKGSAPRSTRNGIQLAAGVRLVEAGTKQQVSMLICADEKIQLNENAVAILRLCDGSRSRQEIVAEVAQRSRDRTLAADIGAFLDAAQARGWIVEAKEEGDRG
jgi:pyrroloquinoline quinone biosynthesis protein D